MSPSKTYRTETRQATSAETVPRIYVASLSDYNAGRLYGAWIDAAEDVDGIWEGVRAMLAASPMRGAEEWAIHDYEGFGELQLSEFESMEHVATIAAMLDEHGPAWAAWADHIGLEHAMAGDPSDDFADAYDGEWDSFTAYVEEMFDQTNEIPEHLAPYIDYERIARDWECSGEFSAVDNPAGGVWVFNNR